MMKKIGLLGGTFDPPHIGHFIIAQEVVNHLQLDEIWLIPTNVTTHKNKAFISQKQRLEMLEAAVKKVASFKVHPIELYRSGKSYTINTIKELQQENPDDDFYFIIGADMVEYLPNWYQIDTLFSMIEFIGVSRPNYSLQTIFPITVI